MTLHSRLATFIKELNLELDDDLQGDTSLIKSGLFDSLALLNVALWIEQEIGRPVDPSTFDLSKEWDTIDDILNFVERHRANDGALNEQQARFRWLGQALQWIRNMR